MMYWFVSDSEEEDMFIHTYSTNTDSYNYTSSEYSDSEVDDLSQEGYSINSDTTWEAEVEKNIPQHYFSNMNMNDDLHWLDSDSPEEGAYYENYSTVTESSPEYSHSENGDLSEEEYTSSVDIGSDTEIEDDKYVIFIFYQTLSTRLFRKFSIKYLDIITSLQHMISNYSQVSYGILPTEIDYTKKSHCVGYLHRYAACHAALVFDAMSDIFDPSSSDVLLSKLHKKSLNVMFIGGGPGNDLVGFLTALYSYHHHLFDLDVTIVDKMSGWEDVFSETVENLRRGDCGKAGSVFEELNITTTFISADLKDSEEWDKKMHAKLQNADIIFFVKALSHIQDGDKIQVLQNVVACMKPESYLIYIDYPYPYRVFSSLSNHLRIVYQAWEMRYILGYKDYTFGCSNIASCRAVVKVFARYEDNYSSLYF